jgi:predicted DNA-binding transcriptional regulator AlpA
MADRFITLADVSERTSLSKTEIYRRIGLGEWKVVFLEAEIDAWMAARVAASARRGRAERASRARRAISARWAS